MIYQNSRISILLTLVVSLLSACAAKPRVEIYMQPIEGKDGSRVNTITGALIVEKRGVTVTVEPLDEVELFELSEAQRINPYISVGRWGKVEPLYTVFEITVRNTDNKRVVVGETSILIDEHGEQYGSLPYDYFRELYDDVNPQTIVHQDLDYRYNYPASYYHSPYRNYYRRPYASRYYYSAYNSRHREYHVYQDARALNNARMFARESVFDGSKLFPGAKQMGLLIFERLDAGATDVRVVVPEVLIADEKGNHYNLNFEFYFRQVVAVEEE